jgi:hypothetical protein
MRQVFASWAIDCSMQEWHLYDKYTQGNVTLDASKPTPLGKCWD